MDDIPAGSFVIRHRHNDVIGCGNLYFLEFWNFWDGWCVAHSYYFNKSPKALTNTKSNPPIQIPTKTLKNITIAVDRRVSSLLGQVTWRSSARTSRTKPNGKRTSRPIAAKIGMDGIISWEDE